MQDQKALIKEQAKKVGRELIRSNNLLNDLSELTASLQEVYSNIANLEELTEGNPVLESTFKEQLRELDLLPLFKKMESQLNQLRHSLNKFEENSIKANVFLENYRRHRVYSFLNSKSALSFVLEALSLFAVDSVSFKPAFIGTIDLNKVAKTLKLEKKLDQSIEVPRTKVEGLINYLLKSSELKSFKLESPTMKITWLNPSSIQIESKNPLIKRLDHLCKSMEGQIEEEH
jgi:hypothetical protein